MLNGLANQSMKAHMAFRYASALLACLDWVGVMPLCS